MELEAIGGCLSALGDHTVEQKNFCMVKIAQSHDSTWGADGTLHPPFSLLDPNVRLTLRQVRLGGSSQTIGYIHTG